MGRIARGENYGQLLPRYFKSNTLVANYGDLIMVNRGWFR